MHRNRFGTMVLAVAAVSWSAAAVLAYEGGAVSGGGSIAGTVKVQGGSQSNITYVIHRRAFTSSEESARREFESFLDRYGLGRDSQDPFAQSDEGNDQQQLRGRHERLHDLNRRQVQPKCQRDRRTE